MTKHHTIYVRNVAEALPAGLRYLAATGLVQDSRAGPVLVAPGPVTTVYSHPWECVLTSPVRDANPFFHLAEALFFLAGRNDVAFLTPYVRNFVQYAEPDGTIHDSYGHRWRRHFGLDQLEVIVKMLRANPSTRQAVLQMWDCGWIDEKHSHDAYGGAGDLEGSWAGRPCNTHAYFRMRDGKLDMTVCCRSNDALMGAYGANAVHFAFLHQYVAAAVGVPSGDYAQFSHDYHVYERDLENVCRRAGGDASAVCDMLRGPRCFVLMQQLADAVTDARPVYGEPALVYRPATFLTDCENFCRWVAERLHDGRDVEEPPGVWGNDFINIVALPALQAHAFYRRGEREEALVCAEGVESPAWRAACTEWLQRRARA